MKNIILLVAVLTAIFSGSLYSQPVKELVPVSGSLRYGEEIWYTVKAVETGILVVETSGEVDTYLEAYDEHRNLITEDDDGGDILNARIEMLVKAGNTYLFKLRAYEGSSGIYSIWTSFIPVAASTDLRIGSAHSGPSIASNESHWYTVRATAKGFLTVETIDKDIDTFLEAYDSNYKLLTHNDDGGVGLNARIDLPVEANQIIHYKIMIIGNIGAEGYTITANLEPFPVDTDRNTERSRAVNIRLGEAFTIFFLQHNETRWYKYEITRAQTKFAVQTRGNIDTMLSLYDSQGNLVAEDDDTGEDTNAFIFETLNPGVYYIEVKTYDGVTGTCTIHAETR